MATEAPFTNGVELSTNAASSENEQLDDGSSLEVRWHRFFQAMNDVSDARTSFSDAIAIRAQLTAKDKELAEKSREIQKLKSTIHEWQRNGDELVREAEDKTTEIHAKYLDLRQKLDEIEQEKSTLAQRALVSVKERADQAKEIANLKDAFEKAKSNIVTCNGEKARIEALYKQLESRMEASQANLDKYRLYENGLIDLDTKTFVENLDTLWASMLQLVKRYFGENIPEKNLEGQQKIWVSRAGNYLSMEGHSVQIPMSNSPAARCARVAVVLNILSDFITRNIFTALPIPPIHETLDKRLFNIAKKDARKESICRAILLSEANREEYEAQYFQDCILGMENHIGPLLQTKVRQKFLVEMKQLLRDAVTCWEPAQCCSKKVIATMDYNDSAGIWRAFELRSFIYPPGTPLSNGGPDDSDEVAFLAFPTIFHCDRRPKPIFRGWMILAAEMREAVDEKAKERSKRRHSVKGAIPGFTPSLYNPTRSETGSTISQS